MCGAIGNGITPDGNAFHKLINLVNKQPGSEKIIIECRGKYILTGGPLLSYPFKPPRLKGIVKGIPPLTRDNIFIDARGADFIIPKEFHWERTKRGGNNKDHFAVGWHFKGDNCQMLGGRMIGNLDKRNTIRGPRPSNFGGQEFGLVMQGRNWKLIDVYAENWGTDCLNAGASGEAINCTFKGARRNCVSIVPRLRFTKNSFVLLDRCSISNAGNWPEHIRNNPGAGIDIEGIKNDLHATVEIKNTVFIKNKMKDLQISRGARDCIIQGCTFSHDVKLQPEQKGGHTFINNKFLGEARIKTIYGMHDNPPIIFRSNEFNCKNFPPFKHRVIKGINRKFQGQRLIFTDNKALNWNGKFSSLPFFTKGNVFANNETRTNKKLK
ncbi:hypothetical protein GCM10009133_35170 [Cocleimonas flava]